MQAPAASLEAVLKSGHDLASEQQAVLDIQLSKEVRARVLLLGGLQWAGAGVLLLLTSLHTACTTHQT